MNVVTSPRQNLYTKAWQNSSLEGKVLSSEASMDGIKAAYWDWEKTLREQCRQHRDVLFLRTLDALEGVVLLFPSDFASTPNYWSECINITQTIQSMGLGGVVEGSVSTLTPAAPGRDLRRIHNGWVSR